MVCLSIFSVVSHLNVIFTMHLHLPQILAHPEAFPFSNLFRVVDCFAYESVHESYQLIGYDVQTVFRLEKITSVSHPIPDLTYYSFPCKAASSFGILKSKSRLRYYMTAEVYSVKLNGKLECFSRNRRPHCRSRLPRRDRSDEESRIP